MKHARRHHRRVPKKDPRVDAYIARSGDFAQPILRHLRKLVHRAIPDVEESIKWNMPSFLHHGIVCNIAAFKAHCVIGFWKSELLFGKGKTYGDGEAMGEFGRLTSLADLPPDAVLLRYLKKAAELNEKGMAKPAREKKPRTALRVPTDLKMALSRNKRAQATFDNFSYSHRKEYIEWITGAKREETRQRRLETAVAQMADGKSQNWKHERR